MKPIAAVDFETSFEKGRDIESLGVTQYLAHKDTDIYLVSIVTSEGFEYVGHPHGAPWEKIQNHDWVSHNRTFDKACYLDLKNLTFNCEVVWPERWHCSADLAAFCGLPRSLAGVWAELTGEKLSKEARDKMKGKEWGDLTEEGKEEMRLYALEDSRKCLAVWQKLQHFWPEEERQISEHTGEMCLRGIGLSSEIHEARKTLETARFNEASKIPWHGDTDAKGKPVPLLSPKRLNAACEEAGVPAPVSTALTSESFKIWLEKYEEILPWTKSISQVRSLNRTLRVVESMIRRAGETRSGNLRIEDLRLFYSLKYFGAHTGRWSGDNGLNLQNQTTRKIGGVNLRHLLQAPTGKTFLIADYAQIEARVALYLAQDQEQLDKIAEGFSVYEAHARQTMGYTGESPMKAHDPEGYKLAKARVLGLGFGCGAQKFQILAKTMCNLDLELSDCRCIVKDFRRTNTKIVKTWNMLDHAVKKAAREDGYFEFELPSGRKLHYYNCRLSGRGVKAQTTLGGVEKPHYGGLLFENIVQATARDILRDAILEIEGSGIPVVLHVHDEVICEVPESEAPSAKLKIEEIMGKAPAWLPGIPLGSEANITNRYEK